MNLVRLMLTIELHLIGFILRPCQHDDGDIGRLVTDLGPHRRTDAGS